MGERVNKTREDLRPNRERTARARVFVVDDHPALRQGLAALMAASPDLTVCGEASTAAEALERIPSARPDAAVVDIALPGPNGLDLIRDLKIRHPDLPVIVYSMHDEQLYAERALRAGARGYVMKQSPPARLLEGIRAALSGDCFLSEEMHQHLAQSLLRSGSRLANKHGLDRLSDRELQVFERLGRGRTTQELAEELHLSPKTIETHRANILRKLGFENSHRLLHAAIRWVDQGTMEKPAES